MTLVKGLVYCGVAFAIQVRNEVLRTQFWLFAIVLFIVVSRTPT